MTGVRTITLSNGTSQTVNIMNVQYTDQDTFTYNNAGYLFLSDNLIFASGVPELSAYGIEFNLSSNVLMQGVTEGGQAIPAGVQGGSSSSSPPTGPAAATTFTRPWAARRATICTRPATCSRPRPTALERRWCRAPAAPAPASLPPLL